MRVGWMMIAVAAGAVGCGVIPGLACTEIGCFGGLTVTTSSALELGDHRLELDDGALSACDFTVGDQSPER